MNNITQNGNTKQQKQPTSTTPNGLCALFGLGLLSRTPNPSDSTAAGFTTHLPESEKRRLSSA